MLFLRATLAPQEGEDMAQTKKTTGGFWQVGGLYMIRTVTMIVTGKLVAIDDHEITLTNAAWIADTGRYAQAVESAEFAEVEPYPDIRDVAVGRGALVDAVQIPKLPRTQK